MQSISFTFLSPVMHQYLIILYSIIRIIHIWTAKLSATKKEIMCFTRYRGIEILWNGGHLRVKYFILHCIYTALHSKSAFRMLREWESKYSQLSYRYSSKSRKLITRWKGTLKYVTSSVKLLRFCFITYLCSFKTKNCARIVNSHFFR